MQHGWNSHYQAPRLHGRFRVTRKFLYLWGSRGAKLCPQRSWLMFNTSGAAQAYAKASAYAGRAIAESLAAILSLAFVVSLSARFAGAQAAAEYGQAVAAIGANVTGLTKRITAVPAGQKLDSTLSAPDKKSAPAPPPSEEVTGAANLRDLEHRAGKDAAKLNLKSTPAKASVLIDGRLVGRTPLLVTLAPGSYKVEMQGPRMESGKQAVELHPLESRDVELHLSAPPRYPTHIELR